MGPKLVSVIRNSGVSAVEGVECIEVYGDTVHTFRNIRYIASVHRWGVSVKRDSTVQQKTSLWGLHFKYLRYDWQRSSHAAVEPSQGHFLPRTNDHYHLRSWPHPLNWICTCVVATIQGRLLFLLLSSRCGYYSECSFYLNKYSMLGVSVPLSNHCLECSLLDDSEVHVCAHPRTKQWN